MIKASFAMSLLCSLIVWSAATHAAGSGLVHFRVKLAQGLAGGEPLSGRLLVFMRKSEKPLDDIEPDFTDPNAVYIAAKEVTNFTADTTIDLDADDIAFPKAFSLAPTGDYQMMALLDRDHSYTYDGEGPGDLKSAVIKSQMPAGNTEITLERIVPERKVDVPKNARLIDLESPMLSAFWGRPIKMQASVVLPPSYDTGTKKYPTVYVVHGYGGTHLSGLSRRAADLDKKMRDGTSPEMIYVFLNAKCPLGHHVFADSANNGPWGTALVNEFIPNLEKQFRMDAKPSGRFLTGHSSGGWTTMWVMVTHPDFFGGTWSTSPDPVDFRNFTGPDITKYPPQNAYIGPNGGDYNLVRDSGKDIMTVRQYAQQELVLGDHGGQFASFNAVFSPKGDDGRPMTLFDTETGRIDPFVQKAWEKYDISRLLRDNWKTLGPKLKGKIHIIVGTADTFHLDEAVRLLDGELKKLGSDAKIDYIEGRTHFDLYKDGLAERIANEMYSVARPTVKAKTVK